jgi:hypothetical protein
MKTMIVEWKGVRRSDNDRKMEKRKRKEVHTNAALDAT